MAFLVEVVRMYSACDLPDDANRRIRLNQRRGQRCTSWLLSNGQMIGLDVRKMAANSHSKRGESIEVFKARVEGVFPFLQ